MCKIPQEPLTVICVQVEQILKLIKLHRYDENAKTNLTADWKSMADNFQKTCREFGTRARAGAGGRLQNQS